MDLKYTWVDRLVEHYVDNVTNSVKMRHTYVRHGLGLVIVFILISGIYAGLFVPLSYFFS